MEKKNPKSDHGGKKKNNQWDIKRLVEKRLEVRIHKEFLNGCINNSILTENTTKFCRQIQMLTSVRLFSWRVCSPQFPVPKSQILYFISLCLLKITNTLSDFNTHSRIFYSFFFLSHFEDSIHWPSWGDLECRTLLWWCMCFLSPTGHIWCLCPQSPGIILSWATHWTRCILTRIILFFANY